MATFAGAQVPGLNDQLNGNNAEISGFDRSSPRSYWTGYGAVATNPVSQGGTLQRKDTRRIPIQRRQIYGGAQADGEGVSWFEQIHVFPRAIEFGNVVSEQTRVIEAFSAYRRDAQILSDISQNAGAGITLEGLPGFPFAHQPQSAVFVTLKVSTAGPPSFDGVVLFDYLTEDDIPVTISGNRVVMFPFAPESGVVERLLWGTSVQEAADGSERRLSYRKAPRQELDFDVAFKDDEDERIAFQNLLFEWASRVFGVPVWFEARKISADVTAGDATVQADTRFGDFRVGGLAMVWSDAFTFDALQVDSLTDTSITFASPLGNDYKAGRAFLIPLRAAVARQGAGVQRAREGIEQASVTFRILDNDVDLADATAFNELNSKPLLDDPNLVNRALQDDIDKRLLVVDNQIAQIFQTSLDQKSRYESVKAFLGSTPEEVWQIRGLLHALRGSQKSFYLPTFYPDFRLVDPLIQGSDTLNVAQLGYTDYVNQAEPNASIGVFLKDGTRLYRTVTDSTAGAGFDTLVVDSAWPDTYQPDEVDRICYVRLVRIADDRATLRHERIGVAFVTIPTKAVFQ